MEQVNLGVVRKIKYMGGSNTANIELWGATRLTEDVKGYYVAVKSRNQQHSSAMRVVSVFLGTSTVCVECKQDDVERIRAAINEVPVINLMTTDADDSEARLREWKAGFAAGLMEFVQLNEAGILKKLKGLNELECHAEGLDDGYSFFEGMLESAAESTEQVATLRKNLN